MIVMSFSTSIAPHEAALRRFSRPYNLERVLDRMKLGAKPPARYLRYRHAVVIMRTRYIPHLPGVAPSSKNRVHIYLFDRHIFVVALLVRFPIFQPLAFAPTFSPSGPLCLAFSPPALSSLLAFLPGSLSQPPTSFLPPPFSPSRRPSAFIPPPLTLLISSVRPAPARARHVQASPRGVHDHPRLRRRFRSSRRTRA